MDYKTLKEIVAATHLSQYVDSVFDHKGGLFLIAPPGGFKTTITETLDHYSHTKVLSDINLQSLIRLREAILAEQITTIAFSDFAKLYKRSKSVSANVEGTISALVDEGFRKASFQNQQVESAPARCVVIGSMTTQFFEQMSQQWSDNGLMRRFVCARYRIQGLNIIENAIMEQRKARLDGRFTSKYLSGVIPNTLDSSDLAYIEVITRHVSYRGGDMIMLQKIWNVLKWKHGKRIARELIEDFAPCLSKDGGVLVLKETQ